MKILGSDKFSEEDIDGMRETLFRLNNGRLKAKSNIDKDLRRILWEGFVGWKNIPDAEVVKTYQNIYGETDNVDLVICDKSINEQQGEIVAKFNDIQ